MGKFFHFEADVPCIFETNNQKTSAMHHLTIETDEKEFSILCTPLNSSSTCTSNILCVKVINDIVLCTSSLTEIYKIDANNYKIFITCPKTIVYKPKKLIYNSEINNILFLYFDGTLQKLDIKQNNQTKSIIINEQLDCINIEPFDCMYALCGKRFNEDYVQIFNEQAETLFEGWCTHIEVKNNEIIVLKEVKDIAKHGYVSKYALKNNKIVKTEGYSVYLEESPHSPTNTSCLSLAFIEALNINNIKLARMFLSYDLNNILSDAQLVQYFGNYEGFEPNFLVNANNSLIFYYKNEFCKIFNFEIQNSKIIDITTD